MKILQVIPYFYPAKVFGGPVEVVHSIGKELAKKGHEVVVFTSDARDRENRIGVETAEIDGMTVRYHRNLSMFLVKQFNLFILPEFWRSLGSSLTSFDVIHLHEYTTHQNVVVRKLAKKYGVPYILQVHGSLPKISRQYRKWMYDVLFGNKLLNDASKVVALSQTEAKQYRDMGVPEEKIVIIPNGIALSEYTNLPPKGSFKKKFSISNEEKLLLYLGRINKVKGIDLLARAFAALVDKMDCVRLAIVGPDDGYLAELKNLINTLEIEDRVVIAGPLYGREKLSAYVDSDVYVLPSRYEAFSITVLEAMACGIPIILSEKCNISESVRNKTGLIVNPSPTALEKALLKILTDEQLQLEFRSNCQQTIKRFDVVDITSKLEETYKKLALSHY